MRISDWSSDLCSSDLCLAAPATQVHQCLVDRDLPQPAPERAAVAAPEVADPRDHLEHRLLQHVRRRIAVAADAQGQGEHRALEAAVDLFEGRARSEEHTSELQSLMRISYAVFCLKKKKNNPHTENI